MSSSHNTDASVFCNLCNFLTVTSYDHESKDSAGVCRECDLKFAQPNREKWKKGWRPEKEDVEKFKSEIRKSVYSILSEIDNYL